MPLRRLATKKLYNARDLGGYPTQDGGVTRFGVFVRSEAPVGLPEEDVSYLLAYGISASMDFRSSGERSARPSDLKTLLPYYEKPLFNEAAMSGGHFQKMMKLDWGEQYLAMAEGAKEWAVDVLSIAAENPGTLLYHCTTGKDRTGLLSCYLLSIAGVAKEDIAADYCVSAVYLEPVYARMRAGTLPLGGKPGEGKSPASDPNFFQTPASAMLQLIEKLEARYGGVVEYLRAIGVSDETMAAIRAKFVER